MTFTAIEHEFERRLDQCWLSVVVADVVQLGRPSGWVTVSRDVRASAAVMAMAEFEGLIKDSIEALHEQIEISGLPVSRLRLGVRLLHFDGRMAAASSSNLDKAWTARLEVAGSHATSVAPKLPRRDPRGYLQPVGSATPAPSMLARLWNVYELAGTPFPQLRWQRSLGELVEIRNDVAHRRERLVLAMTGPRRSADAMADLIIDLRDLGRHVVQSIENYASSAAFVA
jgi:hypothetical protein